MTAALDPEHALAFLRLLSTDISAAAVLDADGSPIAGSRELAETVTQGERPIRDGEIVSRPVADGTLFVGLAGERIVSLRTGPNAIGGLIEHDLRRTMRELI